MPGFRVWKLYGVKDENDVVCITENTGSGSNTTKFQRFCDNVFNKGYVLTQGQVEYLSYKLSLRVGAAFDIAKIAGALVL